MQKSIQTFIINLKKRTDRKAHILHQFNNKPEFNAQIVEACEHEQGAIGLWNSIKSILKNQVSDESEFIIISEDDHLFTNDYNKEQLINSIKEGECKNADILLGGVSWFTDALKISDGLFWVDIFSGTQFFIVYRKFFNLILEAEFTVWDSADYKIAALSQHKLLMYPFISTQKEFGYSDITSTNSTEGSVNEKFKNSSERLMNLNSVAEFYDLSLKDARANPDLVNQHEDIMIPVYIINLLERGDRLAHIKDQFKGRNEFELNIVEACKHEIPAVGLWQSIMNVIQIAIEKDEDVIIICEDDHQFTANYSKDYLFNNIIEAAELGIHILSGGISDYKHIVPLTNTICWIDYFTHSPFTVIYKDAFSSILTETFSDQDTTGGKFSEMTSHKMLFYPLISVQTDLKKKEIRDKKIGLDIPLFQESSRRLMRIYEARNFYIESFTGIK